MESEIGRERGRERERVTCNQTTARNDINDIQQENFYDDLPFDEFESLDKTFAIIQSLYKLIAQNARTHTRCLI